MMTTQAKQYTAEFVDRVHSTPWSYAKNNDYTATGWDQRLTKYAWATAKNPTWKQDYDDTVPLLKQATRLAKIPTKKWAPQDDDSAILVTRAIFHWGRVSTRPTLYEIKLVFDEIMKSGGPSGTTNAPMNSSWTKLAAFASHHLGIQGEQVIYDSRVAWAIIKNLDQILPSDLERKNHFPYLGFILPRQPKGLNWSWPNVYTQWSAQIAATEFCREVATILNSNGAYPKMPNPNNNGLKAWDVWGVGQVLFMEGQ
jgi:hypothetical protein